MSAGHAGGLSFETTFDKKRTPSLGPRLGPAQHVFFGAPPTFGRGTLFEDPWRAARFRGIPSVSPLQLLERCRPSLEVILISRMLNLSPLFVILPLCVVALLKLVLPGNQRNL